MAISRSAVEVGVVGALGEFLIFNHFMPPVVDVRANEANNSELEKSERTGLIVGAAFLVLLTAFTQKVETFAIAGGALVAIDFAYKHANAVSPASGTMEGSAGGQEQSLYAIPDYEQSEGTGWSLTTYTQAQYNADDWYVSPGGNIWYATGAKGDLLKYAAGWQGPMTYAQALAISKTTPAPEAAVNKVATNAADAVGGQTGALEDIGNFFHELSEASVWERVGEVLVGGILLIVGLRAMTQGSSVAGTQARKTVTSPAKKVTRRVASVAVPEARYATRRIAKRTAPKTTSRVASHRANVRKYGAKKPYTAPKRNTSGVTHIYHHKATPWQCRTVVPKNQPWWKRVSIRYPFTSYQRTRSQENRLPPSLGVGVLLLFQT
jgi:hypothetical protein